MTEILTANDFLQTNTNTFVVNQPNFVADGFRFSDTRRIGLALKYNFGLKPRPEKKQAFAIPQEVVH
ncbi:MAG: hypothetical protein ACKVOM_03590 [Ferruginibacter sp.]